MTNARKTVTTGVPINHNTNRISTVPTKTLQPEAKTDSQRSNILATSARQSVTSTPQVYTIKPNVSNRPSTPAVQRSNARTNAKAKDTIKTQINLPNANP